MPSVDLHGNLSQNARTRNMEAFHSGKATTLVATDIAARGIHVDDVALVVHADPPTEHKAYLHRSGRTARAGASGTVITLMTDEQVRDVRALTRAAGIHPTTTKVDNAAPPDAGPARPRRAGPRPRWPRDRRARRSRSASAPPARRCAVAAAVAVVAPAAVATVAAPVAARAVARRAAAPARAPSPAPSRAAKPGGAKQGSGQGGRRRTAPSTGAAGSHTAASFSSGRR